jgi:organic radical activating enzyme
MPTKGMPKRERKGKWFEVISNANLNHALLIRDMDCLKELSEILAEPDSYKRDEGRFTSDYTIAQYFAHKGIPMYGVAPAVAKQCSTYSDNEKKVIERKATFDNVPENVFNRKWDIIGNTQFPIEWNVEQHLSEHLRGKGYIVAKVHPPFDVMLKLTEKSDVSFALLNTSRIKDGESVQINISGNHYGGSVTLPNLSPVVMPLEPGEYKIICNPEGEMWRWKHVAILVNHYTPGTSKGTIVEVEEAKTDADKILEIPQLEINIAKGCNLKCKHCGHFSPYRKGLVPLQDIVDSIAIWSQKVSPKVFILGGGEPFLNENISALLYESRSRFGGNTKLRIFSNGALIPTIPQHIIDALKETHTEIFLSDHAEPSQNISSVLTFLRTHGIPCRVHNSGSHWKESYQISENGIPTPFKSSPHLAWKNCPARCCHTLADGKLFKCSRLANVYQSIDEGVLDPVLWKDAVSYVPLLPSADSEEIRNHLNTNEIPQCTMCPDRTYHIKPLQLS